MTSHDEGKSAKLNPEEVATYHGARVTCVK